MLATALVGINGFAFDHCMHTVNQEAIDASRVVESETMSFGECPESILLNSKYVRNLTQIRKVDQKTLCTYGHLGANLTCIQD